MDAITALLDSEDMIGLWIGRHVLVGAHNTSIGLYTTLDIIIWTSNSSQN